MSSTTPLILPVPKPVPAEWVLELSNVSFQEQDSKRRAVAQARLVYYPATPGAPAVASADTWQLQAPLGPIEADDLRWYLEKYAIWPGSAFAARKAEIEDKLQHWGRLLYAQAMPPPMLAAWAGSTNAQRCFSVLIDATPEPEANAEQIQQAREAAGALLALPWELLHDGSRFLFQGEPATSVRRRLAGTPAHAVPCFALPIRVLLICPRPDVGMDYLDHRLSARPLVEAAEALPGQVLIHILQTPNFSGLQAELARAQQANQAYHVLHFDGHGVYDADAGQGGLCFEHPNDSGKWENRRDQLVNAAELGSVLQQYNVPLVFLEACQSGMAESATESVAGALLQAGVGSIVAMSYSVLVETTRRFVRQFYQSLTHGARVGEAMLTARQYLAADTVRGRVFGEGEFHLQDWFVPVLYQDLVDPVLFHTQALPKTPSPTQSDQSMSLAQRLGDTPAEPESGFIGRSRELLALQRRLVGPKARLRFCVILGQGGEGKTTLAAECARWLVRSQQVARVAFVSVERQHHLAAVVDALGRQLVGSDYSVAQYPNLGEQCKPLEHALRAHPTLLVLDNMESILPPPWMPAVPILDEQAGLELEAILRVMQHLMAVGETRVIFTSREALPVPFAAQDAWLDLAQMDLPDAVVLIEHALGDGSAGVGDAERTRVEQIEALAQEVHCHARTLALLAPSLREYGVVRTQAEMVALMEKMEREFPGKREKSLFASVELSLARLSPENRKRVRVLGVFHGAVALSVLQTMTDWPEEDVADLAQGLLQTGLATLDPYDHLTLLPALCPWLAKQLSAEETHERGARWQEAMIDYVQLLVQQQRRNSEQSATLSLLELANMFALLGQLARSGNTLETIDFATDTHSLLQGLNKPQLMQRVGQVRDEALAKLGEGWQQMHFDAARTRIEQQLAAGHLQQALDGAQTLLERAVTEGAGAYPGADYDCAGAQWLLGRALLRVGHAETALPLLQQAKKAFTAFAGRAADAINKEAAEYMASASLSKQADCLCELGQLDAAATIYQTVIAWDEQQGDVRGVAIGQFQLATVYRLKERYREALSEYEAARSRFDALNESATVATTWTHIGMVFADTGNPDKAEDAYRQSLAINVRLGNIADQADTLGELGRLYDDRLQRPEQAVVFYQQALDKYLELGNKAGAGRLHNNLADTLRKLGNLHAAKMHIREAIACNSPLGHAAEPWKSWAILANIETVAGDTAAAQQANQEAQTQYLAYRRAGGGNHSESGRLCAAIHAALNAGDTAQAQALVQKSATNLEHAADASVQALLAALLALTQGRRDPALALDPRLHYQAAVEIKLLLETLPPAPAASG